MEPAIVFETRPDPFRPIETRLTYLRQATCAQRSQERVNLARGGRLARDTVLPNRLPPVPTY